MLGHNKPSVHSSHLYHHRHAHSWMVVLRQNHQNLNQMVTGHFLWPVCAGQLAHDWLGGQHAACCPWRAWWVCGSEFWLSTAGHCRQQNFLNLSQHVYLFVYNNMGYMIIFFSNFFPLKYRCEICLFQNIWKNTS